MSPARDDESRDGARMSTVVLHDSGRQVPLRLVVPTTVPANGFAVVAFGHGFFQRPAAYDSLLAAIARRGHCVVAPDTETGPWPRHARLADDLWRAAAWARRAFPWSGKGDGLVLAGHSMGAAAALYAAARHRETEAVVALAALQTRPPFLASAITAPTLFVVGSQDRIVPPSRTRRLYDAMTAPAHWALIEGGYHCGFLDRARLRDLGCDHGDLPRRDQLSLTGRIVGDWLDARFGDGAFSAPPGVDLERR